MSIIEDWTLTQLEEAIKPDQNKWLTMWMTHVAGDSLKALLKRLYFAESLEMLSVYACVLNDSALMSCDIERLKECKADILKARREMCTHGYEMCPALLVPSVLSDDR